MVRTAFLAMFFFAACSVEPTTPVGGGPEESTVMAPTPNPTATPTPPSGAAPIACDPLRLAWNEVGKTPPFCPWPAGCPTYVDDEVVNLDLGWARLEIQTRVQVQPDGQPLPADHGPRPYVYRLIFEPNRRMEVNDVCVTRFSVTAPSIEPLDFDDDGRPDDAFVVRRGLGDMGPTCVGWRGEQLDFVFDERPVCPDLFSDERVSSRFFGFAAGNSPRWVAAEIELSDGRVLPLRVRSTSR